MAAHTSRVPNSVRIIRRSVYFTLVVLTTLGALFLLTGAFAQQGLKPLELILLFFYTLLILWVSTSFWSATMGFLMLLGKCDHYSLTALSAQDIATPRPDPSRRTVIVMPVYNEDPDRVFAGLRSIYHSLQETGRADEYDLFILSDTRDPDVWIEEEIHWHEMCRDFNAHNRIFYRNREKNLGRKSGNIEEFCQRWGSHYRYMIVLDADSIMGGETLVKMVDLMEANPRVALLQTPPIPVNQESLFARILQFASSLYGTIFAAGTAFWQLSESNYWGHNAIIRMQPFIDHCGLPKLPGSEPFGGEIFSHDFVEAAFLRKAGWEVWLAYDLKESYEELPPTLIDYAKRDRRWCQGNMQHAKLIFARELGGISRLHFMMGIMSYLSSPLWLIFLIVTGIEAYVQTQAVPAYFFGDNIFPVWPESYAVEMTTVLLVTLAMLFAPKAMSLLVLFARGGRDEIKGYGGVIRVTLSVVLETFFSMLTAPILMLYQSKFVLAILMRSSVGWPPQQRGAHRLSLKEAFLAHGGHTLVGIVAGTVSYIYVPGFFLWLTPVLAGLILAIPVSILSSSTYAGEICRRWGLFLAPEEQSPPRVLNLLTDYLEQETSKSSQRYRGIQQAVIDPGINALHLALLPVRTIKKRQRHQLKALLYQMLEEGVESLSANDKRTLISDPEIMQRLHVLAWGRTEQAIKPEQPDD